MVHDTWRPGVDRRAREGDDWLDRLVRSDVAPVELVRGSDGLVIVVEEQTKRAVRSGILAAALERSFGPCRAVPDAELSALREGVPVELFEGEDGQPFLLVGGELRRVRGIPLTHPVDTRRVAQMARGADIDVAAANVSRRRLNDAMSGQFQLQRLRSAVKRKGVAGTAAAVWRRASRAVRKRPDR